MSTDTEMDNSLARASSSLKASATADATKSASKRTSVIGMITAVQAEAANPMVQAVAPVATQTLQLVQSQIDNLGSASKFLTNALDDLTKIHPFVSVAVLAFKTALQFELTRRQNDKRIMLIQVKMNDMFSVLLILRKLGRSERGGDGKTVEERLGGRITSIANDIEKYSAICDTFSKKKTIVKLFRSLEWEGKLEGFIQLFEDHKQALQEDLAIYSSVGIQQANATLATVSLHVQSTDDRTSTLLLLRALRSPTERDLLREIELKGGAEKVLKDEGEMRKLIEKYGDKESPGEGKSLSKDSQATLVRDITRDLNKSFSDMIQENEELFTRKFKAQQEVLREEMSTIVSRESDRVIGAITSGPHDKILDKDLYEVWRESGWKAMVKARNLVLGVREYYAERHKSTASTERLTLKEIGAIVSSGDDSDQKVQEVAKLAQAANREVVEDAWALEYITISRIQPLLEAFDDDASSLVSIAEVNEFTKARPKDWSLPKWLAYWSAGYPLTLGFYFRRIQVLLARISVLAHEARARVPGNNIIIDYFTNDVSPVHSLDEMLAGVYAGLSDQPDRDQYLFDRFKDYVDAEEARIQKKLESVKYLIDAEDTLRFVVGSVRMEKNLLPLIYLLLRRAWHVFRHARSVTLHPQELINIADSFTTIYWAACKRADHLTAKCKLQNIDPKEELRKFSYGIYYYCKYAEETDVFNTSEYMSAIYLRSKSKEFSAEPCAIGEVSFLYRHLSACRTLYYADLDFVKETEPPEALLYPAQDLDPHVEIYDSDELWQPSSANSRPISWTGHHSFKLYDGGYSSSYPIGVVYLTLPPPGQDGPVTGSGMNGKGAFTITGTLQGSAINLTQELALGSYHFVGTLNDARDAIEGTFSTTYPADVQTVGTQAQDADTQDTASEAGDPADNGPDDSDSGAGGPDAGSSGAAPENQGRFELHVARTRFSYLEPTEEELAANKARALWRFAIESVLNLVRIKCGHFTWPYLKERRRVRQRFIELYSRLDTDALPGIPPFLPELSSEESDELALLASMCSKQDLQLYQKLSVIIRRRISVHWGLYCDGCGEKIVSVRCLCLDCLDIDLNTGKLYNKGIGHTVDLCSNCITKEVIRDAEIESTRKNHLISHALFETRIPAFKREEWDRIFYVKSVLNDARASDEAAANRHCAYCQDPLSTPYWYCIDCEGKTCVCMKCKVEKDDALAHEDECSYAGYASAVHDGRPIEDEDDDPPPAGEGEDAGSGGPSSSEEAVPDEGEASGPVDPASASNNPDDAHDSAAPERTSEDGQIVAAETAEEKPDDDDVGTTEEPVNHSFRHQFLLYKPTPATPESTAGDPIKGMFVELRDRISAFDSRLERLEALLERLLGSTQSTGKAMDGSEDERR